MYGTIHPENANTTNYLNRYWTVTTSGITDPSYGLTAKYLQSDVTGSSPDEAKLIIGSYSTTWTKLGTPNTTDNTLTIAGLTSTSGSFSSFSEPTVTITNGETETICAGENITLNTEGRNNFV